MLTHAGASARKLVPLPERMEHLTAFVTENPDLLASMAQSVGGGAGGSKHLPDDRVAARIIETVAKLSVAQQRQVLARAKLLLAPSG